eukprot:TRINITY_DN7282_c0_g1_i1.p1 TRINITY_DN7282_c0_g1~~TRINITY_DN7282_c0_g1_i1.p1  ORF type:complete len:472 (-),score=176.90 TRINITY_DN7282_c0_g1_i1:388-1803(-)
MNWKVLATIIISNCAISFLLLRLQFLSENISLAEVPQPADGIIRAEGSCAESAAEAYALRRQRTIERVTAHISAQQSKIHEYSTSKYLLYSESGSGVGNRFNGLVTAMLFAIVSQRVFLLQAPWWPSEFLDSLDPPYPWHIANFDQAFPGVKFRRQFDQSPESPDDAYLRFECCWGENKTLLAELKAKGVSFLDLDMTEGSTYNELCCHDWPSKYGGHKFVTLRTNQYMLVLAQFNPHTKQLVDSLFDGFDPFGIIAASLLRFRPELQAVVDGLKAKYEFERHFMVGLQVRTGVFRTADKKGQTLRYLHCADRITQQYSHAQAAAAKPAKYFICSDDQGLVSELRGTYGSQLVSVTSEDLPAVPKFNSSQASGHGLTLSNLARLVDIWLLAACDELVLTDVSTFGTVASGMAMRIPHVVLQEGVCIKRVKADACFTYSWALPYQSCYKDVIGYQQDWSICQHDYWRVDPWP